MKSKFLLLLLLTGSLLTAQPSDRAKLDTYFKSLEDADKFMGVTAVSQNGKTIYSKASGFADFEAGKKLDPSSKFRIGSISKMFTAAMVMKAVEENKLKLDDKLSKYFPSVPNADKISLEQMLRHRSGIHNFTNDANYTSWLMVAKTRSEMLATIAKNKSQFEPGSKSEYSNSNYVLLSYILEDLYKKPYSELLAEKITKPLGLKNTYYGGAIDVSKNEARSYKYLGKWETDTQTDMSIPVGAGAIVSNAEDLSRFIEALFDGKVVNEASLIKMKTLQDEIGLGLFTFPFDDRKAYGHTGGIDSFRSMLAYFPEDKVTYVLLSNASTYKNNDIGIATLNWFYNKPFDVPQFTKYTHKPEELDKFIGVYASAQMPLKITITKGNTILMAQATGQQSFPLDATSPNIFKFDRAGLVMEFTPEKNEMILKQGGGMFTFTKE